MGHETLASGGLVTEPLAGHSEGLPIWDLSFSPDGTLLASGGVDGNVILWNTRTWQQEHKLDGHDDKVRSVSFSPDGATLASSSLDGNIILWDVVRGKRKGKPLRGHTDDVTATAFTRHGEWLVSASKDNTLRLWDIETHEPVGAPLVGHGVTVPRHGANWDLATVASGTLMASAGPTGSVLLWDVEHQQPLTTAVAGHEQPIGAIAVSPDGRTIASTACSKLGRPNRSGKRRCLQHEIRLWDARHRRPLEPLLPVSLESIRRLVFSPDGNRLAAIGCAKLKRWSGCERGGLWVWDMITHSTTGPLREGHGDYFRSAAFSPDGGIIATGSCARTESPGRCTEGEIKLWGLASPDSIATFGTGNTGNVQHLRFGEDGRTLAWVNNKGVYGVMEIEGGRALAGPIPATKNGRSATMNAAGTLLAYRNSGQIHLWDVATWSPVGEPMGELGQRQMKWALSPDGELLAIGGCEHSDRYSGGCPRDSVQLWRTSTQQRIGPALRSRSTRVRGLAFIPDDKVLLSSSDDGEIVFWDLDPESWLRRACDIASRALTAGERQRFVGDRNAAGGCDELE